MKTLIRLVTSSGRAFSEQYTAEKRKSRVMPPPAKKIPPPRNQVLPSDVNVTFTYRRLLHKSALFQSYFMMYHHYHELALSISDQ